MSFTKRNQKILRELYLPFSVFFFAAAPFCIGNYLTESKDETLQKIGFLLYWCAFVLFFGGGFLWMYLPSLRVRKRIKKLLKHLGIDTHNELAEEHLKLECRFDYPECSDTEYFYVNYLVLYGNDFQKRRLIELMSIKKEHIDYFMNRYNEGKSLERGFWHKNVSYCASDNKEHMIRLCQTLGIEYPIGFDINWCQNIVIDILEKEGLIHFPEELHSPDYRKYKEYIQKAPR